MNISELPELLKTQEVADFLRLNKMTINRWVKGGKIPAFRMGPKGQMRIKKADIVAYLATREGEAL